MVSAIVTYNTPGFHLVSAASLPAPTHPFRMMSFGFFACLRLWAGGARKQPRKRLGFVCVRASSRVSGSDLRANAKKPYRFGLVAQLVRAHA